MLLLLLQGKQSGSCFKGFSSQTVVSLRQRLLLALTRNFNYEVNSRDLWVSDLMSWLHICRCECAE